MKKILKDPMFVLAALCGALMLCLFFADLLVPQLRQPPPQRQPVDKIIYVNPALNSPITSVASPVAVPVEVQPTSISSSPTVSAVDTNVPAGYKRIKVTLVGTGFSTQPQQTNQVNQSK